MSISAVSQQTTASIDRSLLGFKMSLSILRSAWSQDLQFMCAKWPKMRDIEINQWIDAQFDQIRQEPREKIRKQQRKKLQKKIRNMSRKFNQQVGKIQKIRDSFLPQLERLNEFIQNTRLDVSTFSCWKGMFTQSQKEYRAFHKSIMPFLQVCRTDELWGPISSNIIDQIVNGAIEKSTSI